MATSAQKVQLALPSAVFSVSMVSDVKAGGEKTAISAERLQQTAADRGCLPVLNRVGVGVGLVVVVVVGGTGTHFLQGWSAHS